MSGDKVKMEADNVKSDIVLWRNLLTEEARQIKWLKEENAVHRQKMKEGLQRLEVMATRKVPEVTHLNISIEELSGEFIKQASILAAQNQATESALTVCKQKVVECQETIKAEMEIMKKRELPYTEVEHEINDLKAQLGAVQKHKDCHRLAAEEQLSNMRQQIDANCNDIDSLMQSKQQIQHEKNTVNDELNEYLRKQLLKSLLR